MYYIFVEHKELSKSYERYRVSAPFGPTLTTSKGTFDPKNL